MDLSLLVGPLGAFIATLPAGTLKQVLQIAMALFNAWPAIQKGYEAEKPYLDAMGMILSGGAKPADEFDAILTNLQVSEDAIAAQIAADDAAQGN